MEGQGVIGSGSLGPSSDLVNMVKTLGTALLIQSSTQFVIDSGATDHMCNLTNLLFNVSSSAS